MKFVRTLNLGLVRPSVHSSVRSYVLKYLKIHLLLSSETLQLVISQKGREISKRFCEKNPILLILAKNCPNLTFLAQNAQKWTFFSFLVINSLEFANFLYED